MNKRYYSYLDKPAHHSRTSLRTLAQVSHRQFTLSNNKNPFILNWLNQSLILGDLLET